MGAECVCDNVLRNKHSTNIELKSKRIDCVDSRWSLVVRVRQVAVYSLLVHT